MLAKAALGAALAVAATLAGVATRTTESGLALFTNQAGNGGNTFTTAASFASCSSGSTGFLNPSANVADTGRSNDGFELNPTNACADGGGYASNFNNPGDRHRFYDYNIDVDSSCAVYGIEVRLDWWLDNTKDQTYMEAELSWDGGTTWTPLKTDTEKTTSEHTVVLGGSTDTWGRTWSLSELSNANFRVRVTTTGCCSSTWTYRDFFLDWVPVNVYYGP